MATRKQKKAAQPKKKKAATLKKQIKISKAQAWVNAMPIQPTIGGTLHVVVTLSETLAPCFLQKITPQGINPTILMLEIIESDLKMLVYPPQTITYVEHLSTANQYKVVEIYVGGKKKKSITKIPIIK